MDLVPLQWFYAVAAALLVGFSKTGVPGLGMLIVPLMAMVFPTKLSVGALLPMLIVGDVFALAYYRRHAQWNRLWGLFPWIIAGMAVAYWMLSRIDDDFLRLLLGWFVLGFLGLELARKRWGLDRIAQHRSVTTVTGFAAGFATTMANVAGPIMSIYLASKGLEKKEFMGTGAWYYFLVNCTKVPMFWSLGMITGETLRFDARMIPAIIIGALVGKLVLPLIPQKLFVGTVLALAGVAAVKLLFFP